MEIAPETSRVSLNGKLNQILTALHKKGWNWSQHAAKGLKNIDVRVLVTDGGFDHRVNNPSSQFLSDHHIDVLAYEESRVIRSCPKEGNLVIASL